MACRQRCPPPPFPTPTRAAGSTLVAPAGLCPPPPHSPRTAGSAAATPQSPRCRRAAEARRRSQPRRPPAPCPCRGSSSGMTATPAVQSMAAHAPCGQQAWPAVNAELPCAGRQAAPRPGAGSPHLGTAPAATRGCNALRVLPQAPTCALPSVPLPARSTNPDSLSNSISAQAPAAAGGAACLLVWA